MRRHIALKSPTCTERVLVNAAGISAKVKPSYPGRSADLPGPVRAVCYRASRGDGMGRQKAAEGIVGRSTRLKARTR